MDTETQPVDSNSRSGIDIPSQPLQQPTPTLANVFRFTTVHKKRHAPILNESDPLSMFYHADQRFNKQVKRLQASKVGTNYYALLLTKVHNAQKLVLETIFLIYLTMPNSMKSNRDYRFALPQEDQRELDSGKFLSTTI